MPPRFAACLLLCLAAAAGTAAAEDRPNVVFLLTDDQSCDSLGCYGNPDVQTPHLDRLARDGVAFDNHYDTTAICMASRATVMTGLLEYRTGCNFSHGPLTQSLWEQSYPMALKRAGYRTAFAGKFGFEVVDAPGAENARLPADDFDRWGGSPGQTSYATRQNASMREYADEFPHSTLSYGAFGRDFVQEAAGSGEPFCLSISFKSPHMPDTPDPRFDAVYAGKTFRKPANYGREHGLHFSEQSRQGRQYERFHSWGYADDYDAVMRRYHQLVYGVDAAVGMIRAALEEAGVADRTVVIFTSDNGFLCGAHGYGSKVLPYEEASRVPLIVYDPRRPDLAGTRRDALTGNVDFAPTIRALAGVPQPAAAAGKDGVDGRSLLPLLDDADAAIHESLPLINVWGPPAVHSLAVVTRDQKFVFWPHGGDGMTPTEELYDTAADPLELTDLDEHPARAADRDAMRALYDGWVAHWRDHAVGHNDYRRFAVLFDRGLPWDAKTDALKPDPNPEVRQRKRGGR
ncbi:sulfatase family protein [Alienimonas chondri]|uniref:Choline-sulfatase n=1 Tax=Alienimonas chondri TaxID=2681879 RepID=A0ABX1VF51_9PLAN|nr:sulfatase [Alienimonas chondri]NNJ26359.1 Choline-sulfatase [Alienimonas chondri]